MKIKNKEFIISLALLSLAGLYVHILEHARVINTENVYLNNFPAQFGDWRMTERSYLSANVLDVLKSDDQVMRKYVNSQGDQVWVFIAYFDDQKYGEQIHSPKHCLPGSGWNIKKNKSMLFTHPAKFEANRLVIRQNAQEEIMIYWFWTRNGIITNEYQLKFDLAVNSLLRKPTDAAFIRLNVKKSDRTDLVIKDFIRTFFSQLLFILPFEK